jgi:cytochrome P450
MSDRGPVDAVAHALMATFEGRTDPYPRYEELRAMGPALRSEQLPVWYLTGFEESRQVLRDNRCGKQQDGRGIVVGNRRREPDETRQVTMLFMNPPDHTRLRGLVSRAFTPRRIESLHDRVVGMVDELLDEVAAIGEVDLIDTLAYRLPVRVISELIGVPEADRDAFRPLTAALVKTLEPVVSDDDAVAADAAAAEFGVYFTDLIAERRADPADDLLSALIEARDGDDALSHDEMIATLVLLYAAGFETTTNLIGNGAYALLQHPEQLAALRAEPAGMADAVEEMLRFESPVQLDGRRVFEPIEVAGVSIPAGDTVVTLLGAANRDPRQYDRPSAFDVSRRDFPILSFASGIHYCLGASLARMEGRVVFDRLLDRFATIELLATPTWRGSLTLRGLDELRVRVSVDQM